MTSIHVNDSQSMSFFWYIPYVIFLQNIIITKFAKDKIIIIIIILIKC